MAESGVKTQWFRWSCAAVVVAWGAAAAYYATRELPPGMHLNSAAQSVAARDVTFLNDIAGADAYDHGFSSHTIFDAMVRTVAAARSVVVLDCHLCSDMHRNAPDAVARLTPMAAQLFAAVLKRKAEVPGLQVLVITDPINELYGAAPAAQFASLRAAGIPVLTADLSQLRDRNVLYSGFSRLTFALFGHPNARGGWLPNPLSDMGPRLTVRAWAALANLKSSGRRVLIADDGAGELIALAGTAEPAMASSIDTVTALQVRGAAVAPLLQSELDLARAFGWQGSLTLPAAAHSESGTDADTLQFQWLAEGAISDSLLNHIAAAAEGDSIDIMTDSLSARGLIDALIAASRRGAVVRMILDPQKNASLWASANQSVGSELIAASDGRIHVAWYRTHSERFRAALVLIHGKGLTWMASGSASLTRRDLGDYDLSLDAALSGSATAAPLAGAQELFNTLWNDRGPPGIEFTADVDTWADPSQLRYWTYRLMELLGISRT